MAKEISDTNCLQRINPTSSCVNNVVEYNFKSVSKNKLLYARHWPIESPRALTIIIHGAAEHCARYDEIANELNKASIYAFAHDQLGHGRSAGKRYTVDSFDIYVEDCVNHIQFVCEKYPDLKVFCFGYSMGGLTAAMLGNKLRTSLQGIVLMSPLFALPNGPVSGVSMLGLKFLSFALPNLVLSSTGSSSNICRDENQIKAYETDPLVYHEGMGARMCKVVVETVSSVANNFHSVDWPYLLMVGDHDEIVPKEGSEKFHETAVSTDKTMKVYPGYYHGLHREPDEYREVVLKDLVKWITDRIPH